METKYDDIYRQSIDCPEEFWSKAAHEIHWDKPFTKVVQEVEDHHRWFIDGKLNTCYNALDIHIKNGRGDQVALYYDSPVTNTKCTYTFNALRDRVAKIAGMLRHEGVITGDRVVIYMPMIPEAVMAMLACSRLGAIHSVVFGGFAAHELAVRIDDAKPKVIMSASCGIEISKVIDYKMLLDEAIAQADHQPECCFIYQRKQKLAHLIPHRDLDWMQEEQNAPMADCISVDANHPLYILYTSGTTGKPKGVIRSNGGHCVAMKWSMNNIYNCKHGDVFWAASDIGWVVGHSYIVYAPLISGCSTILYEGKPVKTPDAAAFWRVCEEYKVNVLFSAPTAFRAVKKEDSEGLLSKNYDLSHLRSVFVAGERCDSDTLIWIGEVTGKPVIDHWWQTETGWAICGNPIGIESLPIKPGSTGKPMPGYHIEILDANAKSCAVNELGNIVIKRPLPPSCLMGIWEHKERYHNAYLNPYPGII